MTTALLLTFLSGCSMAVISMIMSGIAREKISFLQYYTISNLLAGITVFLLFAKWSLLPEIDWIPVLLITASIGLVNVLSRGAMVCSFKWGHNGLSTAIRNSSAMLTMFWEMIFLLVKAIVFMQKAAMSSLTWPLLVGINVTTFSLFCRLKWKEKYPLSTVLGIAGCVLGIILIIYGRK